VLKRHHRARRPRRTNGTEGEGPRASIPGPSTQGRSGERLGRRRRPSRAWHASAPERQPGHSASKQAIASPKPEGAGGRTRACSPVTALLLRRSAAGGRAAFYLHLTGTHGHSRTPPGACRAHALRPSRVRTSTPDRERPRRWCGLAEQRAESFAGVKDAKGDLGRVQHWVMAPATGTWCLTYCATDDMPENLAAAVDGAVGFVVRWRATLVNRRDLRGPCARRTRAAARWTRPGTSTAHCLAGVHGVFSAPQGG